MADWLIGLQELQNYLQHIVKVWQKILHGVSETSGLVDEVTVRHLQALAPSHSITDAAAIRSLFASNTIFSNADQQTRSTIEQNLSSVTGMIPSLETFFETLKYLKPCADVMRTLVPAKSKRSTRDALFKAYEWQGQSQICVEYGRHDFRRHISGGEALDRDLGYQMLWLFVIRHFVCLSNATTRKEEHENKPFATRPNPILMQELAMFAFRLGFRTGPILKSKDVDGRTSLAQRIVQLTGVTLNTAGSTDMVERVVDILRRGSQQSQSQTAAFTGDLVLTIERRYGRPFTDDYHNNQSVLYLPHIYTEPPQQKGVDITTFFCVWDMIRSLFAIDQVRQSGRQERAEG